MDAGLERQPDCNRGDHGDCKRASRSMGLVDCSDDLWVRSLCLCVRVAARLNRSTRTHLGAALEHHRYWADGRCVGCLPLTSTLSRPSPGQQRPREHQARKYVAYNDHISGLEDFESGEDAETSGVE